MTEGKKRDRLGIIFDILSLVRASGNSIRHTPLMRRANISPRSFSEYYSWLLAKGFVKEVRDGRGARFVTLTDKGFAYLGKYGTITSFIREFEL